MSELFTIEEIQAADEAMEGFCIECGDIRSNCEPDARKYHCESCGEDQVFGAMECLVMGLCSDDPAGRAPLPSHDLGKLAAEVGCGHVLIHPGCPGCEGND